MCVVQYSRPQAQVENNDSIAAPARSACACGVRIGASRSPPEVGLLVLTGFLPWVVDTPPGEGICATTVHVGCACVLCVCVWV